MKEKLYAIKAIRKAKCFALSTDDETMLYIDMSLDSAVILTVLKELSRNLTRSIKEIEVGMGLRKEPKRGRK